MRPANPVEVLRHVAAWHHLRPGEITGKSQELHVVKARWQTVELLCDLTGRSRESALRFLGRTWPGTSPKQRAKYLDDIGEVRSYVVAMLSETAVTPRSKVVWLKPPPEETASQELITNKTNTPLPPPLGRREDGTNPRALGTNPRALGTNPRAASAPRSRKVPLPEGWKPSPRIRDWFEQQKGWRQVDYERELRAFVDYCDAHGKTYIDHDAAFRQWLDARLPGGRFAGH